MKNFLPWFNGLTLWLRLVLIVVALCAAAFIGYRVVDGLKVMLFGNTEAKREHAQVIAAQEQATANKQIGQAAQNEVVKTYEHDVEIDRTVKEGQDAIAQADHGQQMDPSIDAATAAGLCRVSNDLCRVQQH